MRNAWPYFVPAWLYLPYLCFVTPAFMDLNENVLSLLLVGPQAFALLVIIPIHQGRITWKHVRQFLGLPFLVVFGIIILAFD